MVAADADRAVGAALIRLKRGVPYVDAFGAEPAAWAAERVFVTADIDFKPASRDVKIEFLPAKWYCCSLSISISFLRRKAET